MPPHPAQTRLQSDLPGSTRNTRDSHLSFYGPNRHFTQKVPKKQFFRLQQQRKQPPKIGGVLMKTFSKGSVTRFPQNVARGGGGVLPDFTRRGTNYLHTTLLKSYPKTYLFDHKRMFFRCSAPRTGGVLMNTLSKGSFTRFVPKNGPRGGGRFFRFHQTWHQLPAYNFTENVQKCKFFRLQKHVSLNWAPPK